MQNYDRIRDLYTAYGPMVYRRCLHILKDEGLAMDSMQDVFIRLMEKPVLFTNTAGYLYRMAGNHALNILRRGKKIVFGPELPETTDFDDLQEGVLAKMKLESFFGRLPELTRTITLLRYQSCMTLEEVAETVGLSVSGVRKRLKKMHDLAEGFDG